MGTIRPKSGTRIVLVLIISAFLILSILGIYNVMMAVCYPRKYEDYVEKYSNQYGVDQNLVYAVMKTESGFDEKAVSDQGAKGLMQITEDTFQWLNGKLGNGDVYVHDDLFDPELSIQYGTYFLSLLISEFHNTETVLCAYHAGRGITGKWLKDPEISLDGARLIRVPYKDTAHYVEKAGRNYSRYQKLYQS